MERPGEPVDRATFRRLSQEDFPLLDSQAEDLLEKHSLGGLASLRKLTGNFINTVFECVTTRRTTYILKIQFRHAGQTLDTEKRVIRLLRDILPVSHFCLLDKDCDVIPHPCLIVSKLPGELAEMIFEGSGHADRIRISRLLGEILAAMHALPVSESQIPYKPLYSLKRWRESIARGLFDDRGFREQVEALDNAFYPRLDELLSAMPEPDLDEKLTLVWGDPKFHNCLVQREGGAICLSGVFDFQSAGIGNPLFDFLDVEGNFRRNQADGIYRNPAFVEAFHAAYSDAGGTPPVMSEKERVLCDVVLKANGGRWWWDGANILHPNISRILADVLRGLERLVEIHADGRTQGSPLRTRIS